MTSIGNDGDILNPILWNNEKEEPFHLNFKVSANKGCCSHQPSATISTPMVSLEGTQGGDKRAARLPTAKPSATAAAPNGAP